jgi:hypothetical protein
MRLYADYLRWLYKSGRPNCFARMQNRASAVVYAAGAVGMTYRSSYLAMARRRYRS